MNGSSITMQFIFPVSMVALVSMPPIDKIHNYGTQNNVILKKLFWPICYHIKKYEPMYFETLRKDYFN